ncbi:type II toxin-antitoxin system RelE/ParE family toxin [bacterium]|nr:type II toxin-antitoxin system RelE/ParE family toxin [bacterium]
MLIFYQSSKLEKILNNQSKLVKKFGTEQAHVIQRRLFQLDAANCLADLRNTPGRCHELTGDRQDTLSLDLRKQFRLIFEAADDPIPKLPEGGLDWNLVRTVRILDVRVDTHE